MKKVILKKKKIIGENNETYIIYHRKW